MNDSALPILGSVRGTTLLFHENGEVSKEEYPAVRGNPVSYYSGCFTWRTKTKWARHCDGNKTLQEVHSEPRGATLSKLLHTDGRNKSWSSANTGFKESGKYSFVVSTRSGDHTNQYEVMDFLTAHGTCNGAAYAMNMPLRKSTSADERTLYRLDQKQEVAVGSWQPNTPVAGFAGQLQCRDSQLLGLTTMFAESSTESSAGKSKKRRKLKDIPLKRQLLFWDVAESDRVAPEPTFVDLTFPNGGPPKEMDSASTVIGLVADELLWATLDGYLWATDVTSGNTRLVLKRPDSWRWTTYTISEGRLFVASKGQAHTVTLSEIDPATGGITTVSDGYAHEDRTVPPKLKIVGTEFMIRGLAVVPNPKFPPGS